MKDNSGAQLSAVPFFSEIARESYQKIIDLELEKNANLLVNKAQTGDNANEFEKMKLQDEIDKCAFVVVVFSAMMVEAYIYGYAARNFTDKFVRDYLDKLDPVSKWVIIPRLVTGKELPRDHRWFELLQNLIKQRNDIIHNKSDSFPLDPKPEEIIAFHRKIQQKDKRLRTSAKEAIELLELLLEEMKELDVGEYPWTYSYLAAKSDNPYTLLEDL